MQKRYAIAAADAGQRLDVFVTKTSGGVSRTQVQKWVKDGFVLLNGKKASPHAALAEGDEVTFPDSLIGGQAPAGTVPLVPRPDIALRIVYEDDDVAVVDKPAGLLVHPTVRNEDDTLANALVARYPGIAGVGESPERPGIMHRLDKDASGLLAVAKTQRAYDGLKAQFQTHEIKKEYAVLVHGALPKDEAAIALAIGRAASGEKMAARPAAQEREGDRDAVTHYRVENRYANATFVTARTETGRTHQVRLHFKAIGHAVVGDPLYKPKRGARIPAPRLFLHAKTLGFRHPVSGKRLEFASPLPRDLQKTLDGLRP